MLDMEGFRSGEGPDSDRPSRMLQRLPSGDDQQHGYHLGTLSRGQPLEGTTGTTEGAPEGGGDGSHLGSVKPVFGGVLQGDPRQVARIRQHGLF